MDIKKRRSSSDDWSDFLVQLRKDRPLTTFQVSKICGVVHSTVSNWIDEKKLPAYRTPGGHRRIKKEDLAAFLKSYAIPVPKDILDRLSKPVGKPKSVQEAKPVPRFLVVEDDAHSAGILEAFLKTERPGSHTVIVSDGFDAGKKLVSLQPTLVLLDIFLPGMDGFRVLQNIRSDPALSNVKVIAITGYDTTETKSKLEAAGRVDGYLVKPLDLSKLKALLDKIVPIKA